MIVVWKKPKTALEPIVYKGSFYICRGDFFALGEIFNLAQKRLEFLIPTLMASSVGVTKSNPDTFIKYCRGDFFSHPDNKG